MILLVVVVVAIDVREAVVGVVVVVGPFER
jgi:hypothetical protein